MLKEFWDALVAHAGRGLKATTLVHPSEPSHIYYLDAPGAGGIKRVQAAPMPRNHTVRDLDEIVAMARDFTGSGDGTVASVWYSRDGVFLLLDDAERRDKVKFPLVPSSALLLAERLARSTEWWSQQQFVRLLRVDFANCLSGASLLGAVRQIKFRQTKAGEAAVQHGKASVGRSIEAELTGVETIPETVMLHVDVFPGTSGPEVVVCAIELDVQGERFALTPLPNEIEAAVRRAEASIGAILRGGLAAEIAADQVRVHYGSP